MTNRTNLDQGTYDRLCRNRASGARPSAFDFTRLLQAYEGLIDLLEEAQCATIGHRQTQREAEEFLYYDNGDPKVVTEDEKPCPLCGPRP